jgi:hypothetical protein
MKTIDICVGAPLRWEGVSVFPLFVTTGNYMEYRLFDEAFRAGTAGIKSGEQDALSDLIVENRENVRVLMIAGQELPIKKPNRILNRSVLMSAKDKLIIPARYLQQISPKNDAAWRNPIVECRRQFPPVDAASGFVMAFEQNIVEIELFDRSSACQKKWEALMPRLAMLSFKKSASGSWARTLHVQQFLVALNKAPWRQVETIGEGDYHEADIADLGHAFSLSIDGWLIHAKFIRDIN